MPVVGRAGTDDSFYLHDALQRSAGFVTIEKLIGGEGEVGRPGTKCLMLAASVRQVMQSRPVADHQFAYSFDQNTRTPT